jgi:hypothetical protein
MKSKALLKEFKVLLRATALDVTKAPAEAGLEAMLRFYEQIRVEDCALEDDGDMLLFQWGLYDWGEGLHFELGVTRQVILPDEEDDDAIWQLQLTYRYSPTDALRSVGNGNRWCGNPAEIPEFRTFVTTSNPYQLLHLRVPGAVDLRYECAG